MEKANWQLLHLKGGVDKLISEYNNLSSENEVLRAKCNELTKNLSSGKVRVENLERENERVRLSEALVGGNGDRGEAKRRINDMVREIDRCIALLNNI